MFTTIKSIFGWLFETPAARRLRSEVVRYMQLASELLNDLDDLEDRLDETERVVLRLNDALEAAEKRLREIAAQETPSANATTRRMARIAREGIEIAQQERDKAMNEILLVGVKEVIPHPGDLDHIATGPIKADSIAVDSVSDSASDSSSSGDSF